MVSHALLDLFSQHDGGADNTQAEPILFEAPPPSACNIAGLLNEVDWLGCRIELVDGKPVLKGNRSAIPSEVMDLLKEHRAQIIDYLTSQAAYQPDVAPATGRAQSGIRKDATTGKLHLFGNPNPAWLEKQGWKWSDRQRRFVATYPFDREDPRPRDMIGGGPCLPADFPNIILEPQNEGAA